MQSLSLLKCWQEMIVVSYGPNFCVILDLTSKTQIGVGELGNGVYNLRTMLGGSIFTAIKKVGPEKWHQRLGHPSHGSLAPSSMICDFKLNKEFLKCCDVCHKAKQTRNSFPLSESRASKPFDLIHCDLWG